MICRTKMQAKVQGRILLKDFASNESKLVPRNLDPGQWALIYVDI